MIVAFVFVNLISMLLALLCTLELRGFLQTHAKIANADDLTALKNVARRNMYAALAVLVLGGVSLAFMVALVLAKGLVGAAIALGVYATGIYIGSAAKSLGKKARSLPADPSLQAEYEAVSRVWVKKPLPNF